MEGLIGSLESQRRHVLGILEGLTEEQLRTPVLPSGWHCLGLVRHLALSDEHYWFRCVIAGESLDYFPTEPNGDWRVGPNETVEAVLEEYRAEIRLSNAILADVAPDTAPKQPDPEWASWGMAFPDVRTVLLHVIAETAIHAGHLDVVRELIDGRQWVVL